MPIILNFANHGEMNGAGAVFPVSGHADPTNRSSERALRSRTSHPVIGKSELLQ